MNKPFICCFFIFTIMTSLKVFSQQDPPQSERLKVFLDCSNTSCDQTFIKTEINIVDFLLDRLTADVHILITSNNTGGGGRRYQMIFYGQNRFSTQQDTLSYNVDANNTAAESRARMLQYLKLGLVPFITKTGLVSGVNIGMKQDADAGKLNAGTRDPWNYWVITLSADGNISNEKAYENYGFNGNFSASRVTEALNVNFSAYRNSSKAIYTFATDTSSEKFVAKNSDYGLWHFLVKSINSHWSAGYEGIYSNSTFSNYKRQLYVRAAVEYNIFPYKEVNSRFLTFSYGIITRFNRYYDTTLFGKLKETLFAHSFRVTLALNKKWGTINSGIFYTNYFHDWKLNSLGLNLSLNIRITGGLSFTVSSSGGLVHDQVYLPKSGATEQEILTRLRQLKSSYNFQNRIGISYRFGSKLNNFVNPRFSGG